MSLAIHYDSSFDGFLSVVFEIYHQRLEVGDIVPDRKSNAENDLFLQPFRVETSEEYARRIRRAVTNAASEEVFNLLVYAFHSEVPGIEMKMLAYLRKLFSGVEPNYGKNRASLEMLPLLKIAQSVRREAGDMLGMVRFNKTPDGTYISEIEPKYNILWSIIGHFKRRFPNGKWAILDSSRGYGAYYDGCRVHDVVVPAPEVLAEISRRDDFVGMWKSYYDVMAIQERINPRLLKRCLPVRYWKHLPERTDECACEKRVPSLVAKRNSMRQLGM